LFHTQSWAQDKLSTTPSLDELIDYALKHRLTVRSALIGEDIGEEEITASLSGYYPQIHAFGDLDHFLNIPATVINDELIQMGQRNTSNIGVQAKQAILTPDLMRASRASKHVREGYKQQVEYEKIEAVVDVSKAYFDILTTEEEIKIIQENLQRIQRQFDETYARYKV
ncbi:TolC family protein, partial [Brucella sp. 21LCYQ03]|nr:TolC family protein [Brucella sp. 21LCYQ03]